MDLNLNLNVRISFDEETKEIYRALCEGKASRLIGTQPFSGVSASPAATPSPTAVAPDLKAPSEPASTATAAPATTHTGAPIQATIATAAPAATAPTAPAPASVAPSLAAETAAQAPEGISDDEMKGAMDIIYEKICGAGFQTNADPKVRAVVKKLRDILRSIAAELGGVTPVTLPQERRKEFLERLDGISVNASTGMPEYLPF